MQNITLSNYINPCIKTLIFSLIAIIFIPIEAEAQEIEEITVKASYREIKLEKNDGSLLVLNEEELKAQPIKQFRTALIFGSKSQFCLE